MRSGVLYVLVVVVGVAAFGWPFLLPAEGAPSQAHAVDAPLVTAAVAALAVAAVVLEVRSRRMNGATVAMLGVLSATAGLLRLLNLPGGGNGMFFLVVLAGAAFGVRFGLMLGLAAMATSALITAGLGPWLPFQMLALAWMAAGAGLVGRAVAARPVALQVAVLALYGWLWGFLYGGIMNLWFWPFITDGGALSYDPGMTAAETVRRYVSFYAVTSFGWDAAAALTNALLIGLTGSRVLPLLRRYAGRLDPEVAFVSDPAAVPPAHDGEQPREHRQDQEEAGKRPPIA